jgi:hypothetical protein
MTTPTTASPPPPQPAAIPPMVAPGADTPPPAPEKKKKPWYLRWWAIVLAALVAIGVVSGVANGGNSDDDTKPASSTSQEIAVEDAAEQAAASDGADEAAASDYVVTVGDAAQIEDYEGKPALVVNYTFTNNSDEDANFMFATMPKAFQDGVELETGITMDDSVETSDSLKDIKPGATIQVQSVYLLDSKSDVTVEVTELISFDDTMLATKTFSVK